MKKPTNKVRHPGQRGVLAVLSLVILIGGLVGIAIGFEKLRDLWREQCVITDMERQVSIQSGKMVMSDVIAEMFGLKKGANLATIDFEERRAHILERIPNLHDLRIRRHLPDRVTITIEERTPLARLLVRGSKADTRRVADSEGVVFECARGTKLLPVIYESSPGTAKCRRLGPRAKAALRLVEACREPDFQELGILDVDTTATDYLQATLNTGSSYARLQIAWDGMDAPATPVSRASLNRQLLHLRNAIRTRIDSGMIIWNATDYSSQGRIYANPKGSN